MSLSRIFTDDAAFTSWRHPKLAVQIGPSSIHKQRAKGGQSEDYRSVARGQSATGFKSLSDEFGLPLLKRFSPVTVAPSLDDIGPFSPPVATVIGYQIPVTGILSPRSTRRAPCDDSGSGVFHQSSWKYVFVRLMTRVAAAGCLRGYCSGAGAAAYGQAEAKETLDQHEACLSE
jgi:hypothetical protein